MGKIRAYNFGGWLPLPIPIMPIEYPYYRYTSGKK